MSDRFQLEQEAFKSLSNLYTQADECRKMFERAEMSLPDGLKRFLGVTASANNANGASGGVTAPDRPKMPKEATNDWIYIRVSDAIPQSVMLAILRHNGGPMRPKDLAVEVASHMSDVTVGGVYNMGPRLDGKLIQRGDEGWSLLNREQVPILYSGHLWGIPAMFSTHEMAAHRRDAILYILKFYASGLQTLQIVEVLRKCPWVKAPVTKDLVKVDMEYLAGAGKVRRGSSKKWGLLTESKE